LKFVIIKRTAQSKGDAAMTFVQLQTISANSLLKSPLTVTQYVQAAKERGYQAIALTDEQVTSGWLSFYQACQTAQLQAIFGLTMSIQGLVLTDQAWPLLCFAKDEQGYRQLLKLSSYLMTHDTPPTVATVQSYLSHTAIVVPAEASELALLLQQDPDQAQHYVTTLQQAFPKQLGLGVTLQPAGQANQTALQALSHACQVPLIALEAVRYLDATDAFSTTVLQHIGAGTTLSNETKQQVNQAGSHYLAPAAEVAERYQQAGLAAAVTATEQLAQACQVTLTLHQDLLPRFPVPGGNTSEAYLQQVAQQGLVQRFSGQTIPAGYQQRLDYELQVITKMGFADYFLIIWDVMHHAHQVGIVTGPGRGSAAGSLVAYALTITEVDPLAYQLLFERFLNPERRNLPDIDLDIPDNRREELLHYVYDKYGQTHMAQIMTYGTLAAKQALRDVGRVLGLTQVELNRWSKAVPNTLHIDLKTAYDTSLKLRNLVSDSERNQLLFKIAQQLEGLPRHYSTHAAGIILSDHDLTDYLALQSGSNGIELTQFAMGDVATIGLVKMDFLGLRNLSILANTLTLVSQQIGRPFAVTEIPLDDSETLDLFQKGDTNGVFQFESAGIKRVLQTLKPTDFEDIVAVNALYRPGPMANIPIFIKRKHAQQHGHYPDAKIEAILAPTYGILVYQEQVMQVAAQMGGFTLGQADSLRRAMSKKQKGTIDAQQAAFLKGAAQRGYATEDAEKMYQYIERFANYGFNRSHAVAYSMIAFQLAYLKAHYPAAFFAALLNATGNQDQKTKRYLLEARQRQLQILAPNVNQSELDFTVRQQTIQFGLNSIHGLRKDYVQAILQARQADGKFRSLADYLRRLDSKWLKMADLEPLIYTNALRDFNPNRKALLNQAPELISALKLSGTNQELLSELAPKPKQVFDFSLKEKLAFEAQYLGAYLSGHPVEKYQALNQHYTFTNVLDLVPDQTVQLLVLIKRVKVIRTKRGQEMAFVTGEDATAELDMTCFPEVYRQMVDLLVVDQVLWVTGKVTADRGQIQLIARQFQSADELLKAAQTRLFLKIPATSPLRQTIPDLLKRSPGLSRVVIFEPDTGQKILLHQHFNVNLTEKLMQKLKETLGNDNVAIQEKVK
jgi:DNA polymerase-3 subunit alpha